MKGISESKNSKKGILLLAFTGALALAIILSVVFGFNLTGSAVLGVQKLSTGDELGNDPIEILKFNVSSSSSTNNELDSVLVDQTGNVTEDKILNVTLSNGTITAYNDSFNNFPVLLNVSQSISGSSNFTLNFSVNMNVTNVERVKAEIDSINAGSNVNHPTTPFNSDSISVIYRKYSFNNSLGSENLSFSGNENISRYLELPKNALVLNSSLVLEGHGEFSNNGNSWPRKGFGSFNKRNSSNKEPKNISKEFAKESTSDRVATSPTIASGFVYVGSDDGNIYQLDANNVSERISSFPTGDWVRSSPVFSDGHIYVGSDDGHLYKLNGSNVSDPISNFSTPGRMRSSPIVTENYLYFGSGKTFYQLNTSNFSDFIKFDNAANEYFSSPAIYKNSVYAGNRDNNLYRLNASNVSDQISNFSTGDEILASPSISNGYLYLGSYDHKFYQVNATNLSGPAEHIFNSKGVITSSPAINQDFVYLGAGYPDYRLYRLNASNVSDQISNFSTGGSISSAPAVSKNYVYFGSFDSNIYQLNNSNFSDHENFSTQGLIESSPTFSNGYLYVGSDDGNIYQLRNFSRERNYPQNLSLYAGNPNSLLLWDQKSSIKNCYQETADKSHPSDGNCDLNYSGGYSGNQDSSVVNKDGYVYMNYTKPSDVKGAVWSLKHGNVSGNSHSYNVTVPQSCFDQHNDKLRLRFFSNYTHYNFATNVNSTSYGQCYNGTWNTVSKIANGSKQTNQNFLNKENYTRMIDGNWTTYSQYQSSGYGEWKTGSESELTEARFARLYEEGMHWTVSPKRFDYQSDKISMTSELNDLLNNSNGLGGNCPGGVLSGNNCSLEIVYGSSSEGAVEYKEFNVTYELLVEEKSSGANNQKSNSGGGGSSGEGFIPGSHDDDDSRSEEKNKTDIATSNRSENLTTTSSLNVKDQFPWIIVIAFLFGIVAIFVSIIIYIITNEELD